jgi:hypothetical protein
MDDMTRSSTPSEHLPITIVSDTDWSFYTRQEHITLMDVLSALTTIGAIVLAVFLLSR